MGECMWENMVLPSEDTMKRAAQQLFGGECIYMQKKLFIHQEKQEISTATFFFFGGGEGEREEKSIHLQENMVFPTGGIMNRPAQQIF